MANITLRQSTKYGTEPYAVLTVTQSSQNTSSNSSVVAWSFVLYRPSKVSSTAKKSYSVTINGSTVKSGTTTIGGSGTKTIASGTTTVAHNSDGTKTLSFGASFTFDVTWSGTKIGTLSKTGSMTLSPILITPSSIPSSLNISGDAELGGALFITIQQYNQYSRHKIVFSYGDKSYTYPNHYYSGGTFEFPESRYSSWFGSADSIDITVTMTTYDKDWINIGKTMDVFTLSKPTAPKQKGGTYYYNGSAWKKGIPYVYNSGWKKSNGLVYSDEEWTT